MTKEKAKIPKWELVMGWIDIPDIKVLDRTSQLTLKGLCKQPIQSIGNFASLLREAVVKRELAIAKFQAKIDTNLHKGVDISHTIYAVAKAAVTQLEI